MCAEVSKHRYGLAVVAGTFGCGVESEGHMNVRKLGARFCAIHIAPHLTPVHGEIAPLMADKGATVA